MNPLLDPPVCPGATLSSQPGLTTLLLFRQVASPPNSFIRRLNLEEQNDVGFVSFLVLDHFEVWEAEVSLSHLDNT